MPMIVDCFTHTWEAEEQLGRCVPSESQLACKGSLPDPARRGVADSSVAGPAGHLAAADPVDTTFVLGFTSRYFDSRIPNEQVAAYVRQHPDRLIGLAGVDPSDPAEALALIQQAQEELSMPGLAVAPAAQDFHPSHSQAMRVYAEAARRSMPILFHQGIYLTAATKVEYARPFLLDEVARELPDLKIIIAHLGYPWVDEAVMLLAKHDNVYAEISGLLELPWQAYQALLCASQTGVTDKILFGSGFPHAAASQCIEALYSINHLVHGTNLPSIPREHLRGIVERDTLALLGITGPAVQPDLQPTSVMAGNR